MLLVNLIAVFFLLVLIIIFASTSVKMFFPLIRIFGTILYLVVVGIFILLLVNFIFDLTIFLQIKSFI